MKILKPTIGGHNGSSFRELIDMWAEAGYCEVVENKKFVSGLYNDWDDYPEARPWIGSVGDIMLYDNPILDRVHDRLHWKMALWGNTVHKGENCYPWTFWPKHSKIHTAVRSRGIKKYTKRTYESVFIGSLTTPKRNSDGKTPTKWKDVIQNFWMGRAGQRLFAPKNYLKSLTDHKFGLCLPGVGPKCLRDVELMGLGTVPIFTPGVSTEYYEPPEENKHYLFAKTPEEAIRKIKSCTKEKWEYMSNECTQWFERNCSPLGSFELTKKIIEENYEKL